MIWRGLFGRRRRLGGFPREPQGLQPRHIVEHGFRGDILFGLAGFGLTGLVEARIGAVVILFAHLSRLLFLRFGFDLGRRRIVAFGGFSRQALRAQIRRPFADRDIGRRNLRHRLDAFASWAIFRFSRISFNSAGLFGSSLINCLNTSGAHRRAATGLWHLTMHWSDKFASLGRNRLKCAPFGPNLPSW